MADGDDSQGNSDVNTPPCDGLRLEIHVLHEKVRCILPFNLTVHLNSLTYPLVRKLPKINPATVLHPTVVA